MSCKILSKYIDKDTIRGILFFIKDEDDGKQIEKFGTAELYRQATLCYLVFYERLDAELVETNLDKVIQNNIKTFYDDYDENIQALYKTQDLLSITSTLQMVEEFIKETIITRYEKVIHK